VSFGAINGSATPIKIDEEDRYGTERKLGDHAKACEAEMLPRNRDVLNSTSPSEVEFLRKLNQVEKNGLCG
jgi:hypothetical protein